MKFTNSLAVAMSAIALTACQNPPASHRLPSPSWVGVQVNGAQAIGAAKAAGTPTAFHKLDLSAYRVFVPKWQGGPVLCAVLRTPDEWKAFMRPAAVMSPTPLQFGPPDAYFNTQQIAVLAQIASAPATDQTYQVASVLMEDHGITLNYTYQPEQSPTGKTTFFTQVFAVSMPKIDPRVGPVSFLEKGSTVCTAH